jgi:hypothetical protein
MVGPSRADRLAPWLLLRSPAEPRERFGHRITRGNAGKARQYRDSGVFFEDCGSARAPHPPHHREPERVRAHVLFCMLAY